MSYKRITKCELTFDARWGIGCLVKYPVSYRYNGGVTYKGQWYEGFTVSKPRVPPGFKLVGIGIGLELNSHPPLATQYLRPLDGRKRTPKQLKTILAGGPDPLGAVNEQESKA